MSSVPRCNCGEVFVDAETPGTPGPWTAFMQEVHALGRCGRFAKLEMGVEYAAITWWDFTMTRFSRDKENRWRLPK